MNLQCDTEHLDDVSDENYPIEISIKMSKNRPSIANINENIPKTPIFKKNSFVLMKLGLIQ